MTPGYSGTPLWKKLGLKQGYRLLAINPPDDYLYLVQPLPDDVKIVYLNEGCFNLVHLFTNTRDELFSQLPGLMRSIVADGAIWVSWYKKAAKLPTEITEDTVREAAVPLGLVDVQVCAVDDTWSGLKLVIRKENRS